jgi:DNA-binding GntR family transcriptional regulator
MKTSKKLSNYVRAYNYIKEGILQERYDEAYVFIEAVIADELGISRTPVREAIKMLRTENWLQSVPKKGIVCRPFTTKDIENVYKMAGAVESMIACDIAEERDAYDLSVLQEYAKAMTEAMERGDKEGWLEADCGFHEQLLDLSHNRFAVSAMRQMQQLIEVVRIRYTGLHISSMEKSTQLHRLECEAIISGDAGFARALVEQHWKVTLQDVMEKSRKE